MRALLPVAVLCAALAVVGAGAGCATAHRPAAPLPTGTGEDAGREVLRRFARALADRDFAEAYALLSARWRAAYTPSRLALDHDGAGPVAREAAERVLALLGAGAPLAREGERLVLAVGEGRAAVLVREGPGWRVDALE